MKKSLNKMLSEFLKHRSKSNGDGWAEVAEGDVEELYSIIIRILEMKYQRDSDNSLPVEVDLVDRTKFERSHYLNIPYEHLAKSDEERMEILSLLNANARIASGSLDRHVKILDMIRRSKKQAV